MPNAQKINQRKINLTIELYWAGQLLRLKLLEKSEYLLLIQAIKKKYS